MNCQQIPTSVRQRPIPQEDEAQQDTDWLELACAGIFTFNRVAVGCLWIALACYIGAVVLELRK